MVSESHRLSIMTMLMVLDLVCLYRCWLICYPIASTSPAFSTNASCFNSSYCFLQVCPRLYIVLVSYLSCPVCSHCHLIHYSLSVTSKRPHNVTVVPIDGDSPHGHFVLTVNPQTLIVAMHDHIRDELRRNRYVGEFFRSNLEILPLPLTPTMDELEGCLSTLRPMATKQPEKLPASPVDTFFEQLHVEGALEGKQDLRQLGVHFLVWLPPLHCKFL
jgi:hypothetical protein